MTRLPFRLSFRHVLLALACAGVFLLAGHFAASQLIEMQRMRQLRELNDTALRRAELVADYGETSLDEIARRNVGDCSSSALQVLRLQVYQRSNLKDVRIINHDGSVICSAYSETLEFDKGWVRRDEMLPSADGAALLFRVDQFSGIALGIAKDFTNTDFATKAAGNRVAGKPMSLAAIVGLNASLFDLMPKDLREYSTVILKLSNGRVVAGDRTGAEDVMFRDPVVLSQDSRRYPFRVEMKVESSALSAWDNEPYCVIVGLAGLLGLAFGGLIANAAFRPPSPIAELDAALASGAIKPFFLPTFELRTGRVIGCEVLARWVKADGTVVPPMSFIPLAESSGRIEPLTWGMLQQALQDLYPVLSSDRFFTMSINIMPRHMVAPGFVDQLRAIAVQQRVSPRQIALEVTERDAFPDLKKAAQVIAELRDRGFTVALDDVGIGHNGLSQIQALGANVLKIDKFFVDSISRDAAAHATVEMLVRLAGELKMTVLAEGIETDEQRVALTECGVSEGQGYLVSPPLPAQKFLALVEEQANVRRKEEPSAARVA
jgi:sensor c-di-GMP phosphodiesterase-like protein